MKLRNAFGAVLGSVGLLAVSNRALSSSESELPRALPVGEQRTYRWRGFDVSYTEAGDPEDPDLVALHGINAAASSHEFRATVAALAEDHHVLAPDLPGFGHSDRPPLLYSASLYETFVEDFLADQSDTPTVVASGLTGSYAASAVQNVEAESLILACPTDHSMGSRNVLRRSLLRSPLVGQALFNAVVSKRSMEHFHADHGYYDMDKLTDDVLEYEWHSAHQEGARFAPASFVAGFLDPEADLADVLASLDVETTIVWGRDASVTPLSFGRELADAANARLIVFDEAKLLPHVEHPEQFVAVVAGKYDEAADEWDTHADVADANDDAVDIEITDDE